MKVVIIGAGISGAIAAGALSSYHPQVFDAAKEKRQGHKAIMRLHDSSVCMYLGVNFEEIIVQKAVSFDGALTLSPDIRMNNMYSLKTYGSLGYRSIEKLGSVKRFLMIQDYSIEGVRYDKWVVGVDRGVVTESRKLHFADGTTETYDICISTIPIPDMLIACGLEHAAPDIFKYKPIYVHRGKLKIRSSVHQTLYFPSNSISAYRATIQNQDIIIESIERKPNEAQGILGSFGLKKTDFEVDDKPYIQKIGKILPVDEFERKRAIMLLTERFGIYSFGRFALWKPIRTDHLVKDIGIIKAMILDKSGYTTTHAKYGIKTAGGPYGY